MKKHVLILIVCLIGLFASSDGASQTSIETAELNRKGYPSRKKNKAARSIEKPISTNIASSSNSNQNDTDMEASEPANVNSHSTQFIAECSMPTTFGQYRMRSYTYTSPAQSLEPIVMIAGEITDFENVIVRVHDQCFTGEIFGSRRCDCREQLHESLRLIRQEGGIIIYLQQEGRGIGISNKVAAYSLQDIGMDTVDANVHLGFEEEMREYRAVPDILNDLGIKSIRLVTNNPFKMTQLRMLGVNINERISIKIPPNPFNIRYLKSKRDRMKHIFPEDLIDEEDEGDNSGSVLDAGTATGSFSSGNHNGDTLSWQSSSLRKLSSTSGSNGNKNNNDITAQEVANSVIDSSDLVGNGNSDKVAHLWSGDQDLAVTADTYEGKATYAFGPESVKAAIAAVKAGQMVLVVDDEGRENEGDLILAAEHSTPENIGFIVRHSSGVICVSMEASRLNALKLPPMVINNQDPKQTAYSITVDCIHNTTTGISSSDRAITFRTLANPQSIPSDFQRPGHCFPLRYRSGGVLTRGGHTEASMDLAKLAGCQPVAVLAEVVNDDGSVMRLEGLKNMAKQNKIVLTSVQDLIAYRVETERTTPPASSLTSSTKFDL